MIIKGVLRPEFTHIFPAPVGVQKNPRFLRKFQICGLITLLLDIVCLARGVSGGGFSPLFWSKIATFAHILRPEFGDYFGGSKSGQKWPKMAKMGKNGQNGQKWPKMAFLGGPWVNPHPPPFCGSNLAWKPRFSPKGPFSRIFGGGRFWGGQKGSFLGFSGDFWGGQKGVKKWPQKGGSKMAKMVKKWDFGGFPGGVENGHF